MDGVRGQLSCQVAVTNLMETVRENLIDGCTLGPIGGLEIGGNAAHLPQGAGFHIGVIPLLEQAETALGGGDVEIIEIKAGFGEGHLTAPDFIGAGNGLPGKVDLLDGGSAVITLGDTGNFGGLDSNGNVDIQRTDLVRSQRAEGGLVPG